MTKKKSETFFNQIFILACGMMFLLLLTSCKPAEEVYVHTFDIYYVNNEATGILSREYQTNSIDREELITELLEQLGSVSEMLEYQSPLAGSFSLLGYTISEKQLVLRFDERYGKQPVIIETLTRAALVRTLTQIDGIEYVSMMLGSEPLKDSAGNIVGVMSPDMFIDDGGEDINAYDKVNLHLYFGSETGEGLVSITRNEVVYNSNLTMERFVLENLIAGPQEDEAALAVIHPKTEVINVMLADGICYVNVSEAFLTQIKGISAEEAVYSITNSLVELPNINKVQISIQGSHDIVFMENMNLSNVYERNLDIVKAK